MEDKTKIEMYTAHLKKYSGDITLSGVSRFIGVDNPMLDKAVNGKRDGHGTMVRIPKRCAGDLRKFFLKRKKRLLEEVDDISGMIEIM